MQAAVLPTESSDKSEKDENSGTGHDKWNSTYNHETIKNKTEVKTKV